MNIDDIQTLYAYNQWASRRLLAAAQFIEPQRFTEDLGTSHRSLRGTFVHIFWGEWLWLQRWRGESPKQVFNPMDFADVSALEARWNIVLSEQEDFIAALSEEKLNSHVSYENLKGQRWEYSLTHMLQHVVNHSSYHRGQVAALLRQLGHTPPATDFLVFFDELAARGEQPGR